MLIEGNKPSTCRKLFFTFVLMHKFLYIWNSSYFICGRHVSYVIINYIIIDIYVPFLRTDEAALGRQQLHPCDGHQPSASVGTLVAVRRDKMELLPLPLPCHGSSSTIAGHLQSPLQMPHLRLHPPHPPHVHGWQARSSFSPPDSAGRKSGLPWVPIWKWFCLLFFEKN